MGDADSRTDVLKEIRDEIRGVRSELEQLRGARLAGSGMRTEVVDRAARWRIAAMASTGALAVVALVLALRVGPRSASVAAPPPVASPPAVAVAPAAPVPPRATSAPVALPAAPVAPPAVATKPPAKSAPRIFASAPAAQPVRKRVRTEPPEARVAATDEGDTIPFPPPRHVRVHKMSYGPVESEPAKL
jgi:hypothetical protein